MSYYGSDFYEGDSGEYHWNPYVSSYESYNHDVSTQASISYSGFEFNEPQSTDCPATYGDGDYYSVTSPEINYSTYSFNEPKLLEYYPTTYCDAYDPYETRSKISYSTYSFSEPKLIKYEPTPCGIGYFSSGTQYKISYSEMEFNVPEFVEYDPTPYDGGFDPTTTYGKPLPPSNEICYPRSMPESNGLALNGFSYGAISSPYGKDETGDLAIKSSNGSKASNTSEEGKKSNGESRDYSGHDRGNDRNLEKPVNLNQSEEREEYNNSDYPSSGYDYGYGNGGTRGYGSEYEKQVAAYGSGLEAMDLCESLFGYWPCLNRKDQSNNGNHENGNEGSNFNPWKGAADYIFGSPFGYGEQRGGGGYHGWSIYGGERYYQQ
ncbi:unnamed protein product [Ilex paraguariensis]|uniref:Uncharacterized protein n=1 Tax=Ilex paraguariensis TaxID=185542 RepID=A0ABC8RCE2_9AQUA